MDLKAENFSDHLDTESYKNSTSGTRFFRTNSGVRVFKGEELSAGFRASAHLSDIIKFAFKGDLIAILMLLAVITMYSFFTIIPFVLGFILKISDNNSNLANTLIIVSIICTGSLLFHALRKLISKLFR